MLIYVAEYLTQYLSAFNVFGYITMRAILSALTALILSFALGPFVIQRLASGRVRQPIRDVGPESHLPKAGTPTMGGVLILLAIIVSTLLWADLGSRFVWIVLLCTVAFGIIGIVDDYRKLRLGNSRGLRAGTKFFWQSAAGLTAASVLYATAENPAVEHALLIPYFPGLLIPMSAIVYVGFSYLVIVGSSNGVNLTDGLDGLAIMPAVLVASALGLFGYAAGNAVFAPYLGIPYVAGAGEMLVFCAALAGAGLVQGRPPDPAQVFMGDLGALALGAALGLVAVVVRQELVLFIMGGVFVIETVSVMIQVTSYKLTGRRIFRMAPLHHHFELKGWAEPKVIVRFWIITVVLVLIGLASLKIR